MTQQEPDGFARMERAEEIRWLLKLWSESSLRKADLLLNANRHHILQGCAC